MLKLAATRITRMPRAYQLVALAKNQQKNRYARMLAVQYRSYASKVEKQADEEGVTEKPLPNSAAAAEKVEFKLEGILQELNKLREEKRILLDKYKRALAEGENMRVRMNKQIEDAKIYAIQNFCKDLLDVADTLGNATAAVPKEELNDQNPHLKNLFEGLSITQSALMQIFKRHGLVAMNPLNEQFNPNLHEALFQVPGKGVKANTIIEVSKLGYQLNDRCIRPALVGVAKSG